MSKAAASSGTSSSVSDVEEEAEAGATKDFGSVGGNADRKSSGETREVMKGNGFGVSLSGRDSL